MIGKSKRWMCVALMALAMSASAFIPRFQPLETFFPESGKTDAQGNIIRYYIWTPLGLVAQLNVTDNGSQVTVNSIYYPHSDELGNIIAVSDASGKVIQETFYSPYGEVWAQSGGIDTPWGFGGAFGVYTEPDVELLHMQARYYSPEMKRFISADPTGLKGGVNFYTYADGNPLNAIDPEGLCARPSLFGRTSLFGGKTYSSLRTSSPSWLKPMQSDFRRQQRYGTPFEDRLRGTMAPAVAAASVFNPSAMARGIANDYRGNYKSSGSHYNALNLTFNPVVRGFLNTSQATDGIGYKYHNSGSRLSTGQRVASGVGAAFNAAEAVGVGYVGAKLMTASKITAPAENFAARTYLRSIDRVNGSSLYDSFVPGTARLNVGLGRRTLYRSADDINDAMRGRFASVEMPSSPANAIQRNALAPQFGNTASQLFKVKTRPGFSVEGVAASQGLGFEGGAVQIFQNRPWTPRFLPQRSPWLSIQKTSYPGN
jgi:RHS repeat-associated protein